MTPFTLPQSLEALPTDGGVAIRRADEGTLNEVERVLVDRI
jgi:hypothetical protein